MRRCADRVNLLTETVRTKSHSDYHTDEHILVCLSSSPSNAKIIRTAARMANAFKGAFTALFVETPDYQVMSEEDVKRLRNNMLFRVAELLPITILKHPKVLQIRRFDKKHLHRTRFRF